jgi:hypothetical protein
LDGSIKPKATIGSSCSREQQPTSNYPRGTLLRSRNRSWKRKNPARVITRMQDQRRGSFPSAGKWPVLANKYSLRTGRARLVGRGGPNVLGRAARSWPAGRPRAGSFWMPEPGAASAGGLGW